MNSPFTFNYTAPSNTDQKQPAIFLLHGMGSNEADLPQLVKDFENTHHIFSLRGPIVQKPGYSFFEIEEIGKPIRDIFDKIVTHIQAFIREAIAEYNLNADDITILGFSQGAILAQTIALTMGSEISKVVALSGYIPEFVKTEYSKRSVDRKATFPHRAGYDYVIPSQWGIESKDYFETMKARVTFKTYNAGHGVTPENHRDLIGFLKEN